MASSSVPALAGGCLMHLLGDRPLTHEEQRFMRDHLAEVARVVGFVAAVNLTAAAGGCLIGWGLAHAITHAHNALQAKQQRRRS